MNSDSINFRLDAGRVYSRINLSRILGTDDRTMRAWIREQRRAGVPIVPMQGGGYKIAETDDERQELLSLYRSRALDELTTYSRLQKAMQIPGQVSVHDLSLMAEGSDE